MNDKDFISQVEEKAQYLNDEHKTLILKTIDTFIEAANYKIPNAETVAAIEEDD